MGKVSSRAPSNDFTTDFMVDSETGNWRCPHCPRGFLTRRDDLRRHIRERHEGLNRAACKFCSKPMLKRSLARHSRTCRACPGSQVYKGVVGGAPLEVVSEVEKWEEPIHTNSCFENEENTYVLGNLLHCAEAHLHDPLLGSDFIKSDDTLGSPADDVLSSFCESWSDSP